MDGWNHVALSYNGAKATIYFNGAAIDIGTLSGKIANVHCPLLFGDSKNTGNNFVGLMDDVSMACYIKWDAMLITLRLYIT